MLLCNLNTGDSFIYVYWWQSYIHERLLIPSSTFLESLCLVLQLSTSKKELVLWVWVFWNLCVSTIEHTILWMSHHQIITLSELYSASWTDTNIPSFETHHECVWTSACPRCSMVVSKEGRDSLEVDREMVVIVRAVGHRTAVSMRFFQHQTWHWCLKREW